MNNDALDGLDHATLRHLCSWLDFVSDETDRAVYTAAVRAGLAEYPDAIAQGLTWNEIARRGDLKSLLDSVTDLYVGL
jgi:hypothetical protein